MAVESDDDRLATLEDFGVTIEIEGREIIGIFDNAYEDTLGMMVRSPVITVRDIDITEDRGTTLNIDNVAYTIGEKQSDGQGMTLVVLQKT